MAPRKSIRVPTITCLPSCQLVSSSTRALVKSLSRLSRAALIDLAIQWLEDKNRPSCEPYLTSNRETQESEEEDYAYPPASNIEELRQIYVQLNEGVGTKRDVIDRILDGDWRRGLSLQQLAMVDVRFLEEHDLALRWTALKLVPIDSAMQKEKGLTSASAIAKAATKAAPTSLREVYPSLHASTFLQHLQEEIAPVVKAHYYLYRISSRSLTILRLHVSNSPYANTSRTRERSPADSSQTLFVAFPDSCPFVFVSVTGPFGVVKSNNSAIHAVDVTSLKKIVLEAMPKAMSRPHYRYGLESTSLSAKSLSTIMTLRGPGKHNASNGAYSIFAEGDVEESPLKLSSRRRSYKAQSDLGMDIVSHRQDNTKVTEAIAGLKRKRPLQERDNNLPTSNSDSTKKRKIAAAKRFGAIEASQPGSKGVDRCQITFDDPLVGALQDMKNSPRTRDENRTGGRPQTGRINVVFHGSDIFGGIRRLVEAGLIREERMPAWMTGEMGVSSGVVRNGKLLRNKSGGA